VRLLLAAGANTNALFTDTERDGVNLTPLMCAAARLCCTKVQTVLLDAGADPYVRPAPRFLTALHKAAQAGSSENCKLLVARAHALLEEKDYLDRTALRYATANGLVHTAQALLQCGADINAVDNLGRTALFSACSNGLVDVVVCLLKAGADVHVVDNTRDTTLVAAVQSGYATLAPLLLTLGADISAASTATERALCMAASQGNVPMLQLLVQRGLSVTAAGADATGNTLLIRAVCGGHTAAAEWLLQQGVAVNAANNSGSTALHSAIESSECADAAMIELLLANGADVHKCNSTGEAALDTAAAHGSVQCAKALITAGADVNHVSPRGLYTLHKAVIKNHAAVAQLLLEHGATAVLNKIVPLQYKDSARGHLHVTALMMCEETAITKVLLAAGADVHVTTATGDTCLHKAAAHHTSAAKLCLLITKLALICML
jgi:ankyrin repeat protein